MTVLWQHEELIENTPALEIRFDDVGTIHIINQQIWFPLIAVRPSITGVPEKHLIAWAQTSPAIVPGAAHRALVAIGQHMGHRIACQTCDLAKRLIIAAH